jgi:HicB family
MDTTRFVDAVKGDLEAAAAVGGEALVEAAGRLSAALDASMRLALLDALSEASMELTRQLAAGRTEVRLAGREVELTYVADTPAPTASDDDTSARITLRLPERLKADAETAAARESISTNAWLVRAVSAALTQRRVGGHRLRGFASG